MAEQSFDREFDQFIKGYTFRLRDEGISGVDQYEQKLRNNSRNAENFDDLLFEGRAALMFRHNGFRVTMRESPDLQIELDTEKVYVEVKHFREKEQDRIDERNMSEATDMLVPIGDLIPTEGIPAYEQIANVAIRKVDQYIENAPNVLVVESSSDSLELMVSSAVHEYDDQVVESNDHCLYRLNAIMLVNTDLTSFGPIGLSNVEIAMTSHFTVSLSKSLFAALSGIHLDKKI